MTGIDASATYVLAEPIEKARSIHYGCDAAARVAACFSVPTPLRAHDFPERGNINQHTFLIVAGARGARREYLLQRLNHDVFTRPHHVMAAMMACIRAQREYLARNPLPPGDEWDVITLVPTRDGEDYLELFDEQGTTVWRLMERIPEARTCKSLGEVASHDERLRLAEEAGRGLAMYGDFTSGMDAASLSSALPGYRDTRLYYDQFASVLRGSRTAEDADLFLPADEILRDSTWRHFLVHLPPEEYHRRLADPDLQPFIALAKRQRDFGMTLLSAMESGAIRTVAIHGDTKLDNFLFSTRTGRAKALVDLDTIMPHTWLVDWGDMVRSLVNVAGEKESDPERVRVDMDVFRAIARGFLSTAREVTRGEVALMVDAVQIIALELGVRFLTDYLRGDTYFRVGHGDSPTINKTRAMVQLTLFTRLQDAGREMRETIAALA
ncbi:MAG: phosphotransferase [Armatimonadetes bacterium]|nr:phosphotransferase [Armatimonadota bacterium]